MTRGGILIALVCAFIVAAGFTLAAQAFADQSLGDRANSLSAASAAGDLKTSFHGRGDRL